MIYVALLRGINVGGNIIISMTDLKEAFEKVGMKDVKTYINSGNVIFSTDDTTITSLTVKLEAMLSKRFSYTARVLVKSQADIEKVMRDCPHEWNSSKNLRCNIGFLWNTQNPTDVVNQIDIKDGVDTVKAGPEVIYMTTPKDKLVKSKFNKLVGTKLYKDMTIRTVNTVKKISSIMSEINIIPITE